MSKKLPLSLLLCLLSVPVYSQSSILGDHAISLDLKSLPAEQVITILSERSKSTQSETSWEASGLEQLQGVIVNVDFNQVPVRDVVTEVLGCSGFTFTPERNRIAIKPLPKAFPKERCVHVIVDSNTMVPADFPPKEPTYTYQFDTISVGDFIELFSKESRMNIMLVNSNTDLDKVKVKIDMRDLSESTVVRKLFHCLGWSYQQAGRIVRASDRGKLVTTDPCNEVFVLP